MRKPLNLAMILMVLVLSACDKSENSSGDQQTTVQDQNQRSLISQGIPTPDLERIQTVLKQEVDKGIRAGFVAMVAKDGEIVYQTSVGMADRENNIAMTENTRFRIASMTKAITTAALMQLVESGTVLLNDPVSRYIPAFANMKVASTQEAKADGTFKTIALDRPITLHHLLTHTAGLPYSPQQSKTDLDDLYKKSHLDRAEGDLGDRINLLTTLPLYNQPGEKFRYGYGTDVAGRVIEIASEKSLDTYFRENIFEPLKMTNTEFFLDGGNYKDLAVIYDVDKGGRLIRATDDSWLLAPNEKGQEWLSGGGGLISTTSDYMRFYLMLLNKGSLDGKRLLSPASVNLMLERNLKVGVDFANGSTFGLGGSVLEQPGVSGSIGATGDWGWGGYYGTSAILSPSKNLAVIVMAQQLPSDAPTSRAHALVQTITFSKLIE